jgi:hypothetical protein
MILKLVMLFIAGKIFLKMVDLSSLEETGNEIEQPPISEFGELDDSKWGKTLKS